MRWFLLILTLLGLTPFLRAQAIQNTTTIEYHSDKMVELQTAGSGILKGQLLKVGPNSTVVPALTTDVSGIIGIADISESQIGTTIDMVVSGMDQILVDGACTAGNSIVISTTVPGSGHCVTVPNTGTQQAGVSNQTILSAGYVQAYIIISIGSTGGGSGAVGSVSGDGTLITNSGSTGAVVLTVGSFGAHKWWGNNTGGSATPGPQSPACADLSNSVTSCSVDATNASNISSGTLNAARLPAALANSTSVNGTPIPGTATLTRTIFIGTLALGTSAIASGATATVVTASAPGALTTDNVMCDFNSDPTGVTGYSSSANGILTIIKYITADNVNIKVENNTASSITPGAITLQCRVLR